MTTAETYYEIAKIFTKHNLQLTPHLADDLDDWADAHGEGSREELQDAEQRCEMLESELRSAENKCAELEAKRDSLQEEVSRLEDELKTSEEELNEAIKDRDHFERERDRRQELCDEFRDEVAHLQRTGGPDA